MNLLIDSGNCKNIGDNAMIFNIINYLLEHTNWYFYIVDKGVPLNFHADTERLKIASKINNLLVVPHWRIRDYRKQPIILKQVFAFILWSIFLFRAIALAFDTQFYKKYGTHFFKNTHIRYWAELLNNMDGYWVVGGGNINDIWIELAFWKMTFARIFKMLGKPVVFSGQGIGPLQSLISKWIVRWGIKNISLLSLREKISFELLKSLKVNLNRCFVIGDDALTVKENTSTKLSNIISRNLIALNLRVSEYSFEKQCLIDKYITLIKLLMERFPETKFLFIPIAINQWDSDFKSAKTVIEKISKDTDRIYILEKAASLQDIMDIFDNTIFSLGVSYHFCLFSLSRGIPTIGLYTNDYYKQKLNGLMQMFNQNNGALDLNYGTAEELINGIEYSVREFNKSRALMAKTKIENNWNEFMRSAIETVSLC